LGDIYAHFMNDLFQAEMCFTKILQLDPANVRARQRLIEIHESRANWHEVVQVYTADLEQISDPKARASRLFRIGEINEEHLGKADEATAKYEEALKALNQASGKRQLEEIQLFEKIENNLIRRWRQEGRNKNLIAYFEGLVTGKTSDLKKADALKNLIELRQASEDSLDFCEELLKLTSRLPSDRQSLFKRFVLEKLASAYLGQERWLDLVDIYHQQLALDYPSEECARIRFRLAELQNVKLNLPEEALHSYKNALELNPKLLPALRAYRELNLKSGQNQQALSLFQKEISLTPGRRARGDLYFQMGKLRENHLNQEELAIQDYQQALDLDPENLSAIRRLAVHFYQTEQWEKADLLFSRLASRINQEEDVHPLKKASFWTRRAKIAQQLGQEQAALDYLEQALEESPQFVPALEQLAELYFQTNQLEKAKQKYLDCLRFSDQAPPDSGSSPVGKIYLALGQIEEQWGHNQAAKEHYEKVFELDQKQRDALEALVNLEGKEGNWEKVQKYYDHLSRTLSDANDFITVQLAKADIWENKLDKAKYAVGCYREILEKVGQWKPGSRLFWPVLWHFENPPPKDELILVPLQANFLRRIWSQMQGQKWFLPS